MKALVVYESMFGNTEQIARAVARGLEKSAEVEVVEVSDAPRDPDAEVDLIVAGGPTHAFSMSRERTRADAINRGATEGEQEFGLREWIDALPAGRHVDKIATFDTRVRRCVTCPGRPRKEQPRPLAATATKALHRPRASTSTTSTARCSAANWNEPRPGVAAGYLVGGSTRQRCLIDVSRSKWLVALTAPEAIWEFSLSLWLLLRGFRPSPILTGPPVVPSKTS